MISRSKLHNETGSGEWRYMLVLRPSSDSVAPCYHRVETKTGEVKHRQIINDGLPGCSIQKPGPGWAANGDSASQRIRVHQCVANFQSIYSVGKLNKSFFTTDRQKTKSFTRVSKRLLPLGKIQKFNLSNQVKKV